jgi:hypothetical protein
LNTGTTNLKCDESSSIRAVKSENAKYDESDDDESVIKTESEEYSNVESSHSGNREKSLNEKIHQRIKQLLGSDFNKIKSESRDDSRGRSEAGERVKSGRGKWHYACD